MAGRLKAEQMSSNFYRFAASQNSRDRQFAVHVNSERCVRRDTDQIDTTIVIADHNRVEIGDVVAINYEMTISGSTNPERAQTDLSPRFIAETVAQHPGRL